VSYTTIEKIMEPSLLAKWLSRWRVMGERVVFTNGVFDLLHPGHVDYLERAKALGQRLVVGVNSDASVRRLKPGRPLQDEQARMRVIAALQVVDAVAVFAEDTPLELITRVRPEILVKGADYSVQTIVGAELVLSYGGQVLPLELLPGHSTTEIIRRARELSFS
jgi:D-glycero-beta-D-manno-heptose 1-phosphate adenylyltransferase